MDPPSAGAVPPPIYTGGGSPTGTLVAEPPRTGSVQQLVRSLSNDLRGLAKRGLVLAGLVGVIALGGWIITTRLAALPEAGRENVPSDSPVEPAPQISSAEQERQQQLLNRLADSRIPNSYFYAVVNEAFYLKYPQRQRRPLTNSEADEPLRADWDRVAFEVLEFSEQLSSESRLQLGTYLPRDELRINQALNRKRVNRSRFYRTLDRDLVRALPMYRGEDLSDGRIQQLRIALGRDRVADL